MGEQLYLWPSMVTDLRRSRSWVSALGLGSWVPWGEGSGFVGVSGLWLVWVVLLPWRASLVWKWDQFPGRRGPVALELSVIAGCRSGGTS